LADPALGDTGAVDVLLSANVSIRCLRENSVHVDEYSLLLTNTLFGWTVKKGTDYEDSKVSLRISGIPD